MIPVPDPPEWNVEWDALDLRYDWVRALRGCAQDPVHHAEGDVWIHTRMVLEELAAMPAWRALDARERAIVFTGALMHDIGKPSCTKTDEGGRITSRGHSLRGAAMARRILFALGAPFAARESICALVRYHQVPFFLIERDDARRSAYALTQTARADHLALVAEADARGRRCEDRARLLDNIALFREYCAEERCLAAPATFPSAHARVLYLRGETTDPTYRPHEQFRAEVVLMCGLPGAGKDTWIREHLEGWPVVSLDRVREELDVDPADAGAQGAVVSRARELAREHLRAGRRFVWNGTNVSRERRGGTLQLLFDYGARVRIVYVEPASEGDLRAQNRARAAAVPEAVIDRMLGRWDVPEPGEAHEVTYAVP